jgi:hypothetical protein
VAIAVLGSVALLCWLSAAVVLGARKQSRELAWSVALVTLGILTSVLGHGRPGWHVLMTGVTAALALRNAVLQPGPPRWLDAAGLAAWLLAVLRARMLFG